MRLDDAYKRAYKETIGVTSLTHTKWHQWCGALYRGQRETKGGGEHISGELDVLCVCVCVHIDVVCAVGNCCPLIPTLVIYEMGVERYND